MRFDPESLIVNTLLFILRVRRMFTLRKPSMKIVTTQKIISQKLEQALTTAAYSEIDLNEETDLKCAAVLVPLVWEDEEWHLLYTRRTDTVESHKGQVSFPGGACDDGETTPEQTALREADEEIGLKTNDITILGRLPDMITVSYFQVTPVVGVVKWPTVFQVGEAEVARVFTIPLGWLANPSNRWQFERADSTRGLIAYHP
ncbi:MAG: CoA pyrophosphatase, partial [Anaerolineales bacterium]|nr:CoA pyrophosphatase [Anaerolineales bacterium]